MANNNQQFVRVKYAKSEDGKVIDWAVGDKKTQYGGMASYDKVKEGKATHRLTALKMPVFFGLWGIEQVTRQKAFLRRLAESKDERARAALAKLFESIEWQTMQIGCQCELNEVCGHVDALVWFLNLKGTAKLIEAWRNDTFDNALDEMLEGIE